MKGSNKGNNSRKKNKGNKPKTKKTKRKGGKKKMGQKNKKKSKNTMKGKKSKRKVKVGKKRKNGKAKKGKKNKRKTTKRKKEKKGKRKSANKKKGKKGKRKSNKPKNKKKKSKTNKRSKNKKKAKKTKKGKKKAAKKAEKNKTKAKNKRKNKRKNSTKKNKDRSKIKKTKRKLNKNRKKGLRAPVSNKQTCGSSQVNDTCLENAVNALNFEKNQIQNFRKQKARLTNHAKVKGNKLGKKGQFEDAAKYLLIAIGGNISSPTCGESGTANKARSAKSAADNYKTLLNCSASIKEACTMPEKTYNATLEEKLKTCEKVYNLSKGAADDCRTNKSYITNGVLACDCWSKAAVGITIAKKEGCTAMSTQAAKDIKALKNKCVKAFGDCKKAEDAAVGLIHTCLAGEVKNISATGTASAPSPVSAPAPAPAPAAPTPDSSSGNSRCTNTVMDKCKVANCQTSCTGEVTSNSISSSTNNGMSETTYKPQGASGASCTVTCGDDFKFTTTCQESSGSLTWTKPQTLVDKCG